MQLSVTTEDSGVVVIRIAGEMDMYNAHQLKDTVTQQLEGGSKRLAVDLSGLEYIDSSGIGALLYTFTQAKNRQCVVQFAGAHGPVHKVISLTGLLGFLPLSDNLDAAKTTLTSR